jgi:hypothetical protein
MRGKYMILETLYDVRCLDIIKSFIVETAKYYGANKKECFELALATEESAIFIIDNYPPNRKDIFKISAEFKNNIFKVIFNNMGVPVDEEGLQELEYDIKNPNDTIDGLKFFLIEKLTNKFYFENKGNAGWQTILEKKLLEPLYEKDEEINSFVTKEKLDISLATPQDTYDITKLAYYTYSYSYAKTFFYYPEVLKNLLRNKDIISHIVKNTKGEVVAHIALVKSPDSPYLAESAAMMVLPEYRKTTALLRLSKTQYKDLQNKTFGFKAYYTNLVTSHNLSQRLVIHFDLSAFALKLSVHEQSEIINIDTGEPQRETHLYSFSLVDKDINAVYIFLPSIHNDIVEKLFKSAFFPVNIFNETLKKIEENSEINLNKLEDYLTAEIKVEKYGNDLYKILKSEINDLFAEGYKTVFLKIPSYSALPENFEDNINKLGFFFSGMIAETLDKWHILYTLINNQKFYFENIKLYADISKELCEYIEKEYNKVNSLF